MTAFLSWLSLQPRRARLEAIVQEVVSGARHAARLRVEDRCAGMSVNEMRGYVRARAAEPVGRLAKRQLQGVPGMTPVAGKRVVREATERVVHLVVRELAASQAVHCGYRRAA